MRLRSLVACLGALLLSTSFNLTNAFEIDAGLATEISREIREEFRRTGFNWMSPVHYRHLDKSNNHKPYMFVFLTRSCTDCREILSGLAQENPTWLSNFSAQFNAVLVMDDYGLTFGPEFAPEGNDYVPRIIFADPDGSIRPDLENPRAERDTPYHYSDARQVLWAMHVVLGRYQEEEIQWPSDLDEDLPS